ncbi:hypothetical protein B0I35DRAFT_428652 [Stachybotrys elegans]|uniref:Secreted protein n=1 Tax=Stachybotrys elegans TaxID=80388 RepID=A0A8K0SUD9_9HYPO|nr:hypothetical protein B0I35DRAFT_428652 [Stachybotrys elegans]
MSSCSTSQQSLLPLCLCLCLCLCLPCLALPCLAHGLSIRAIARHSLITGQPTTYYLSPPRPCCRSFAPPPLHILYTTISSSYDSFLWHVPRG